MHGLAQYKLAAQQLHSAQRGGHYGFGAQLTHDAAALSGAGQEVFGHRNGRATQARQHLVTRAIKVRAAQLVGGECNRSLSIRHAQQGFGQTHQGQALGAGNRVFLQQAFHRPKRWRVVAHGLHPGCGHFGSRRPVQPRVDDLQTVGDHLGLRAVRKGQALGDGHEELRLRLLDSLCYF